MVKKLSRSSASSASNPAAALMDGQLAQSVKESAQQIWLAGMGAFSKAQEEGNKVSKVFETLVKEGVNLQKKTQGIAEEKFNEVTGKMTAMADSVTSKAGQNWDKLEQIFEQRTAKALSKLGVPTAKEVEDLSKRLDTLAAAVAKLGKSAPAPTRARASAPRAQAQPIPIVIPQPFVKSRAKPAAKAVKGLAKRVAKSATKSATKRGR